uniref:Histone H2A/H2B/H3 domain-containing protein n=1 Tax=Setaria digitata TaxID=48799 RepID=A0A915Q3I4_9BILA
MMSNDGMRRRTSGRIRKTKRVYSPSGDEQMSSSMTTVTEKEASTAGGTCSSEPSASTVNGKKHDTITLNHNTFWNFATSLRHEKIANGKVITLLLKEVTRAIRQLISGAKHAMQQAERQKLLCDDLNTFIGAEGGKLLYGFTEDNKWQKIGDVFVPYDDILDLSDEDATNFQEDNIMGSINKVGRAAEK